MIIADDENLFKATSIEIFHKLFVRNLQELRGRRENEREREPRKNKAFNTNFLELLRIQDR